MGESKSKERNCVFGVSYEGQVGDPDRIPVVVIGIPAGAWAYMADGKTHSFDLSRVGVPVKLMLFGTATRASAMDMITEANAMNGKNTIDATDQDFAMKPIEDQPEPEGS